MGVPLITNEPTVSKGQRNVSRHVRISTYLRVSPDLTVLLNNPFTFALTSQNVYSLEGQTVFLPLPLS